MMKVCLIVIVDMKKVDKLPYLFVQQSTVLAELRKYAISTLELAKIFVLSAKNAKFILRRQNMYCICVK